MPPRRRCQPGIRRGDDNPDPGLAVVPAAHPSIRAQDRGEVRNRPRRLAAGGGTQRLGSLTERARNDRLGRRGRRAIVPTPTGLLLARRVAARTVTSVQSGCRRWRSLICALVSAGASLTLVADLGGNPSAAVPDFTAAAATAVDPLEVVAAANPPPVPNQLLVRFRNGISPAAQASALRQAAPGLKRLRHLRQPGVRLQARFRADSVFANLVVVDTADAVEAARARAQLAARPDVLYAEPNYRLKLFADAPPVVPNDFDFGSQWGLLNSGQGQGQPGNDIHATDAWPVTTGSPDVLVAVIDTGIDYYHPDLEANVWVNPGEIPGNGLDDDGNGFVDDVHGYDFVSDDSDPMDDHSHGTHVAGIIGAVSNNRIGVAGICWHVPMLAIKAFDDHGEGTIAGVVEAIQYAVANGARLINASWGQTDKSLALQDALTEAWQAGVLIVAAAGNERTDIAPFPAAYEPVVAVAALNNQGARAYFSNFGAFVDLAAPGEAILSTLPNARYDLLSGTSMAAPHVTGTAALVWSLHPDFSNEQIATILRNAVDDIGPDRYVGTGRLDAAKAVAVRSPLPTAKLRLPAVLAGVVDLPGTAAGTNFARYRLEFGAGTYPTNWTPFYESAQPVVDGLLYSGLSSAALDEGTHSIRLVVTDRLGQEAQDRGVVTVRNVEMSAPLNNDSIRADERVEIRGTVFGAGRTYTLEHGVGLNPSTWSTAGITLANGGTQEVFGGVLGYWDTALAGPDEVHTLRLTARANGAVVREWLTRMVHLDSQLRPGWPVHLAATGLYSTNDWRQFTVADLDGDGRHEIIRVQPGPPPGTPNRLLVIEADGSVRWSRDLAPGEPSSDIPVVGDVDGDGKPEIFTDAGEQGWLYAFHADGTLLAGDWPVALPTTAPGKLLADLDHDGHLELVGLGNNWTSNPDRASLLFVLDARTGKLRASWRLESCWSTSGWPRRLPAVGRFGPDGELGIVAPNGCSRIALFTLSRPAEPVWQHEVSGEILASPVVGDLDGDGRDEIVVGTNDPYAVDGRGVAGGLYAFDAEGHALPGWPVMVDGSFPTPLALADFSGDGRLEIVAVDSGQRKVHRLGPDGFDAEGWPVVLNGWPSLRTSPVVGDLDGDGAPDVVLPVPSLFSPAIASGDLSSLGGVRAWRSDGSPIDLHPKSALSGLFMETTGGLGRFKSAQVALTDLDGDGGLDLVAASIDDAAYSPTPPVATRKERYSLYAWRIGVPCPPASLPWPAFQRDPRCSGSLASPQATNHPPVLSQIPNQTVRAGSAFFPIVLNRYVDDPDNSADQLRWTIDGQAELRVTLDAQRVLTVAPPTPDWTGAEALRIHVQDPAGAASEVVAVYAVRADYDPPVARDDTLVTFEDEPAGLDVLANDTHPLGLPLQVESVGRPLHGRVTVTADARLRYAPATDFNGTDSFTYLVVDGGEGMAMATVNVTVLAVPDAPVAEPDHASIDEDTPVDLAVLANDHDPDGELPSLAWFSQPTNGTLTLLAGGGLRYVPATNWSGADGLTYVVTDPGGLRATGQVEIVVKPLNDPPEVHDQAFTLNRNTARDVFYDAHDPEGAKLSYTILEGPAHGELWTYPDIATYYPHKGFAGADRFTYVADDGALTSVVATVSFQVLATNNVPSTEPMAVTTKVNQALTFAPSAEDADADPLTYAIDSPPRHGTVTPAGTNFVYTPAPGYLGKDAFTFRASDGQDFSLPTQVSVTVTDQNTAPVARDSQAEVRMNTPTDLYLLASDGEGDPLRYTILTNPVAGQLSGSGPTIRYTPLAGYVGPDRFSFLVNDGESDSAPATVTVQVVPPNRMPVAQDQILILPADRPSAIPFDLVDPDGDPLRIAILKGPRQGRIAGLGTNYVYTPNAGSKGGDSFTYKAWDGHIYSEVKTVSISLEVAPPPAPPRFEAIDLPALGTVELRLDTEPRASLACQRSTNLTDWTTFTTVTPPGRAVTVKDTNAPPVGPVFYRAVRD